MEGCLMGMMFQLYKLKCSQVVQPNEFTCELCIKNGQMARWWHTTAYKPRFPDTESGDSRVHVPSHLETWSP